MVDYLLPCVCVVVLFDVVRYKDGPKEAKKLDFCEGELVQLMVFIV